MRNQVETNLGLSGVQPDAMSGRVGSETRPGGARAHRPRPVRCLAVIIFVLLLPGIRPASADELERAMYAYLASDFATAGEVCLTLARAGETGSYAVLGQLYELGAGVPQDSYEAVYWARKSEDPRAIERAKNLGIKLPGADEDVAALYKSQAADGDADGSYRAALVSEAGRGMEPDQEAAFKYHLEAAKAGHPYAQLAVAIRYFGGLGVERDDKLGVEWMEKASGQGLPRAKHFLADILTAGLGTEADPEKAAALYKSAAEDGYGRSQMIYGATLSHRAKTSEDRIESLKWMMLALPLLREDELARLQVILTGAINQTANDDEIAEAETRMRAYRETRKFR